MSILQDIFRNHYEEMIYTLHPRQSVIENVDKMIRCGAPPFGGAMYGCPRCGKLKFVSFRCHSRFCPACGNKYAMERTTSMSFKLVNTHHRHCVFTIDKNLRKFFLDDRTLPGCLFHAVNRVVSQMFHKQNKLSAFGYDPLKCECGTTMLFLELYFNHKRVSLEELYEKVMSRSRGKRSSA